jgi:hypothetical protein
MRRPFAAGRGAPERPLRSTTPMTADRHANIQTVRAALGGARARQIGLAIFVAAMAALFTLAIDADSTLGAKVMVYVMTGLFGSLAAALVWIALVKSDPDRSPLMAALRDRPSDVVWLYVQDVKVDVDGIDAPVRDCNVTARLADGSTVAITVNKAKADGVMAALAALAPAAVVGFSEEREARYKADPRSVAQA